MDGGPVVAAAGTSHYKAGTCLPSVPTLHGFLEIVMVNFWPGILTPTPKTKQKDRRLVLALVQPISTYHIYEAMLVPRERAASPADTGLGRSDYGTAACHVCNC